MAVTATVTRAVTFNTGVEPNPSNLNQLGEPTVTVPSNRFHINYPGEFHRF